MGLQIGTLHVRRSILIHASPDRVWQEFVSFDALKRWFSIGHTLESFEPRVGGAIRLSLDDDGTRRFFGGTVLVFDAGNELSFSEDWEDEPSAAPQCVTIRLTPLYDGCHVELFHHGFERLGLEGAKELEGHEHGWLERHLTALREIVERAS